MVKKKVVVIFQILYRLKLAVKKTKQTKTFNQLI